MAFKVSLVDFQGKVVPDGQFRVHRCPRCNHVGDSYGSCDLPSQVSVNGVIPDPVRLNPNGANDKNSRGYMGIELELAPSTPGQYYISSRPWRASNTSSDNTPNALTTALDAGPREHRRWRETRGYAF